MKKLLLSLLICFLCFPSFSQTKAQRYEIYKLKCNTIDTFTIKEARCLKYDTLVLKSYPIKNIYYGKVILNKIRINNTRTLIVIVDTMKSTVSIPIYMFGNPPKTTITLPYDKNFNNWVYKTKTFTAKRMRPVSYTKWTKNELLYDQILIDIYKSINYLKQIE